MQLKKIKLAGFKSFVDPTTVLLPSNLVSIVGPNGCGKSNIIDAVCWVMGENSAKYLRGESLADVIFNGSTARKPVGQASVELVFDNQDGSLGGQYASFSEISIRRQISRDSESAYFLNGTRCRRRDIIDIFLGTGLGPRSYAIIGQNMIARIIEAKPEDMRVYLEEAAGVSRYKERRRETENRIQHTKDNLARLNDVRAELDKQLSTLKRQANAAEKYKILKQEERIIRGEWLAIQWRTLDTQLVTDTLQIQQQATGLEARQTELSSLNLTLEHKRESTRLANESLQETQRQCFSVGNDITRIEQDIAHHEEHQKRTEAAILQIENEKADFQQNLAESLEQLEELTYDINTLEPEAEQAKSTALLIKEELHDAEETMQTWQTEWDAFNLQTSKLTQTAQVEQTRIQNFEQRMVTSQQRQAKIQEEKSQIDFASLEETVRQLSAEELAIAEEKNLVEQNIQEMQTALNNLRTQQQQTTQQVHQNQNMLQVLKGKEASLQALQETALGRRNHQLTTWLKDHQLETNDRLAEKVEVESGWELAVEKVLGTYLQAICVDQLQPLSSILESFKQGNVSFISQNSTESSTFSSSTLLSKVKSSWPLANLLTGVYVADSLQDALNKSVSLAPHESIITREGFWVGASWLRVARDDNPEAGVFQREQELKQLLQQIEELTYKQQTLEETLEFQREQTKTLESDREQMQKNVNHFHAKFAEVKAKNKITHERIAELKNRILRLEKEYEETNLQLVASEKELDASRHQWQTAMQALEQQTQHREILANQREILKTQLQTLRQNMAQAKDLVHELDVRVQTTKSQKTALAQNIQRLKNQENIIEERLMLLKEELSQIPIMDNLKTKLADLLTIRLNYEEMLTQARETVEALNQEITEHENRKQTLDREIAKLRDVLEGLRVTWQGIKVKADTFVEQIQEAGFQIEVLLKELPDFAEVGQWQQRLEQITGRISRLGAINLVAIEEYTSCAERKDYLDRQNDDLLEGLATLEDAIAKIDRETRLRFKETFDHVNQFFQELFPKIFGGGRAHLELIGDNLLEAGVTVMACPPGKRNSTIHLLSGGEKTLTAISLIFSIFQLNPAPFCLLDEVDAPLDDANIGRFCQLVKSMAEKTQFIFISHNKLAIEMGENLIGVTMHEPGVSRLVSVDVKEAMKLAGT